MNAAATLVRADTRTACDSLPREFARIRNMLPLRRLSDQEFFGLMPRAKVERIDAGETLFRTDVDDDWIFYLLEGDVEISDDSGGAFTLSGGSIETSHPLSTHPRVRCLAIALSEILFVRLPIDVLQIRSINKAGSGLEVEELDEDAEGTEKRLIFAVYHDLMDDSFTLPTLPEITLRIRAAAADPNSGADDITRIVQSDPAAAAYCVRMANNAAYATATPVTEVREAVVRMGVEATASMITAYAMKSLFSAPDSATQKLMRAAWGHSARIAALSYVIAIKTGKVNPDQALLSGLLHDIGMLIILSEWRNHSQRALNVDSLQQLGHELSGSLGSMVLRNWQMPEEIIVAALRAEHWSRYRSDALDLCDCVGLAHAHDQSPPPWSLAAPPIEQIAAYTKIADGELGQGNRLRIVELAEQEIAEVADLLKG